MAHNNPNLLIKVMLKTDGGMRWKYCTIHSMSGFLCYREVVDIYRCIRSNRDKPGFIAESQINFGTVWKHITPCSDSGPRFASVKQKGTLHMGKMRCRISYGNTNILLAVHGTLGRLTVFDML